MYVLVALYMCLEFGGIDGVNQNVRLVSYFSISRYIILLCKLDIWSMYLDGCCNCSQLACQMGPSPTKFSGDLDVSN